MKQVVISLKMIEARDPCKTVWGKILAGRGGHAADFDLMFPLSDVLDSNGLGDVLWALKCLPNFDGLWRKYAVWAARQVQHLMADKRSIEALDVSWRYSNGDAVSSELAAARAAAWDVAKDVGAAPGAAAWDAAWSAWATARTTACTAACTAAWAAAWAARDAARATACTAAWDAARAAQENKLRQILDAGEWVE